MKTKTPASPDLLPEIFQRWFAARGWSPRVHQLDLLAKARDNRSALLIAPTGAGKTLAGFLPTLVELGTPQPKSAKTISTGRSVVRSGGLHTLYISPLKALAVDIARNLERPIADMKLPVRVETRTGDTPVSRRQRQRKYPPDILLTTPEQLALLLSSDDAPYLFSSLKRIVLDELHALVTSKRGDLLSLGLARLWRLAPQATAVGLSATVAEPDDLRRYLVPQTGGVQTMADLVIADAGAAPIVEMLDTKERLPWAGHMARHALGEIYDLVKSNKTSLMFVNTRAQAEMLFQDLWRINDDGLAIALHHGSLDVAQRRKVEDAMAAGKLRGVVCTSSLDLGIDWGDIDLVINVGAPKGASRLMQRIGRANHRLDEPSRAVMVPANRFEVLECRAAIDAVAENAQDTPPQRTGSLDVLAQHVLGCACGEPFLADELYAEVRSAAPYMDLPRKDFDDVIDFVATGGYALKSYERFARIKQDKAGRWRVTNPRVRQSYRLNVGTIVEEPMLKVKLLRGSNKGGGSTGAIARGGRMLGQIEEYFIEGLVPGDTFVFGGEVVRYEALMEDEVYVSRSNDANPKVPSYMGGKFPLSTYLAERVRLLLADQRAWKGLPDQVREWLSLQAAFSRVPGSRELIVETFPRADKHYLVCYPFEGRLAHQTLGMLLTRRLERARAKPLGFVANEYALAVWSLGDLSAMVRNGRLNLDALFDADMLGDDLEAWLAESALMKRTFRTCAVISGLIARRFTGEEKSRRQVLFSTDLVYDVLRKHQPDHVLLRAARSDAATGLLDIRRLSDMLIRIKGRITHKELDRVSPLAVPVMLEIGREAVYGEASDELLAEAAEELVKEAMPPDQD
ncbi:MAG TPA: ligase-associated DNA damage response DEXH box helicase [Afipia sp.]|uniref:ligase-associated DNA damage response DEXH box helicase n=1 Tax=Afipia sp. NBIMC_P1-C1 TaxID=1320552 RepID=UPI0004646BEE|nr:ligase-associated DNA damage response DEXH box helicase [Afipia sp. NBIMC_P1-C1]HAO40498.1 ligase-associated DNA damage response DEXH box helicase [Afipia sp.]HAP14419.1 ligase-associated DNA damage response DEXH box helicase [Afipia sp.]HAP47653.1 ligase-associated DNA damage response DEXH box helicase [Afipia sp.]HBR46664.1 ligase-associated DNA damage response DEXH box helicase [Afipia sp.]HCX15497.1 ligase-associated DNA damage response DEXH box helicase [Afipia sp.]